MFVKGVPEEVIKHCKKVACSEGLLAIDENTINKFAVSRFLRFLLVKLLFSCFLICRRIFLALTRTQFTGWTGSGNAVAGCLWNFWEDGMQSSRVCSSWTTVHGRNRSSHEDRQSIRIRTMLSGNGSIVYCATKRRWRTAEALRECRSWFFFEPKLEFSKL